MANENIAQQLVQGSKNIDRMKAEIWMVVQMILGFLKDYTDVKMKMEFENDNSSWHVRYSRGKYCYMVECWVRPFLGSTGWRTAFSPLVFRVNWSVYDFESVEKVYDNLHVFVEGMLREFPELKQKIAPILKASQKFPPAQ